MKPYQMCDSKIQKYHTKCFNLRKFFCVSSEPKKILESISTLSIPLLFFTTFLKLFFSLSLFILTKNEKKRNKNWSIVYNSSPQGNILSGDSRRDIFVISFFQIVSSILPAKVTDDPQKRRVSCRKSFLGCLFGGRGFDHFIRSITKSLYCFKNV